MGRAGQDRAEKIGAAFLTAFGIFVAYYSHHYLKLGIMIMPGAGFLPFYIGIALALLGVAWYVKVLVARPGADLVAGIVADAAAEGAAEDVSASAKPTCGSSREILLFRLLPGILLVLLYAWLFERAGYVLSTLVFMVGWQKLVEKERWAKALIAAAVGATFMYFLFARLLKVFLPSGSWWA